jgi:tRNA U55 pseudouridine synthase TruB
MPVRRSHVSALDVITYSGDADAVASVRLDLHVSSGTYVRSIAHALGGHCLTLRRTEIGPFSVEEADLERLIPPSQALARLPADARAQVHESVRARVLELEREPGAEAAAERR